MQHLPPLSNGKGDSQPANGGGDSQPAPVLARAQPAMQTPVRAKSESSQDAVSIHVDPHIPRQRDSALEIQAVERLPSQMVVGPRAKFFSLHGELIHAFVSYRVVTEGPAGNRLSGTIAQRIRALSLEELQLPRHGWGLWPKFATQPVPFRVEEAKVFLDKDCLQDGQPWLAGIVQGLAASMIFVPLLSWTEDDEGSVGELSKIGVDGFDRVDNVLLELILAMVLREETGSAVKAILPVLIGQTLSADAGGGFGAFPFYKLTKLSDHASMQTNAKAGSILRQMGYGEETISGVLGRSVKQVVELVLRNQGVQASDWGDAEGLATKCGQRVLKTVLQEMLRLRSDPKRFQQGKPMGSEVLEWLQEANLRSYAPIFVHHNLDSLEYVARLRPEELVKLSDEHEEFYPRSGQKGEMGGQLKKLELAHSKLTLVTPARCLGLLPDRRDERGQPLSSRLETYRDTHASALALAASGNGLEMIHTKPFLRFSWVGAWVAFALSYWISVVGVEVWGTKEGFVVTQTFVAGIAALLPLFCTTARQFVTVLQWYLPVYFLNNSVELAVNWESSQNPFGFVYWVSIYVVIIVLLNYCERYFLVGFLLSILLGYIGAVPMMCITYRSVREYSYPSFSECVVEQFERVVIILESVGSFLALLLARELFNFVWSWRAARTSRNLHRALWREELSKVAASPEVRDGLRRLADRIGQELQKQRRQTVRSLGVLARVMAFLNQRTGRSSVRGDRCKARQAHGDIDLLFDEASMVNEPFLDMMASVVAGVGGVDGEGWREVHPGSKEWTGESGSRPGLALKRGPVKRPERALQKLVRVYGRDVAMLTDLVRCTVLAEDLGQVEAIMVALEARSVVGLAGVLPRDQEGGEGDREESMGTAMLEHSHEERTLRITAISNRFNESFDDNKSGGYRDLSLNVEVGWVMQEGVVCFERVCDWEALECQRHICEIQVRLRSQHHTIVNEGLHTRYVELRNQYNG